MGKFYSELEELILSKKDSHLTGLIQELLLDNRNLEIENRKLKEELDYLSNTVMIDPLTGLYDHRILSKVRDYTVVAICDVDNFRDRYDHDGGDKVLKRISQILLNNTRRVDCVCRIQENEFLIVFTGCNLDIVYQRMEKINDEVRNIEELLDNPTSLSIGLAEKENEESLDELIKKADDALSLSKENGQGIITINQGEKVKKYGGTK